ncbi:glycosyltransferase family 4 protein [Sphingorhabdus sp. SMR4y]|uniref:glycosyltransferase family 4 protein n=1 Tax=Sphingorhabdus sp. SMR4y TaxID=2584094 RepID=UPI000B606987|nr:glycosyltransferase family 4 protein [Sphingorhabdus sp. SMR4y]ASK89097.1 glycogen synthase [Sphingorhabdus sp. SMR4y]
MKSILVVGARGIPDVEGGAEKNAERLFPLLASRGWKICIAGTKPHIRSDNYQGVSLWRAPSPAIPALDRLLYSIATLCRAIRTRPDIVHFTGLKAAVLLWAYKLIGCKIVVCYGANCHANPSAVLAKWTMGWLRYQLRWADVIIAVTPALATKLHGAGKRKNVQVIGNALDRPEHYPEGLPAPVSGDYILFVGQISRKKNIHSLIAAFRIFAKNHPQMQLVIVGDWGKKSDRKQIEDLRDDRILLLGSLPRSELAPLYRGARFFVNPSIREGHSNTLLEAISLGCPLLLSDLPENRDLRLNAKHYFSPGNTRSLVSALHRAHANPGGFRVNADRFPQWEEIADRTIGVYRDILTDGQAQRTSPAQTSRI